MSLKRLAAFVSNDNMDPAKTSSRPRYSAGNRVFYRPLRVSRDDNFLYRHHQTLHPSEPPFHSLSSAPTLGIVRLPSAPVGRSRAGVFYTPPGEAPGQGGQGKPQMSQMLSIESPEHV